MPIKKASFQVLATANCECSSTMQNFLTQLSEEYKAFGLLEADQVKKLTEIFNQADYDSQGFVDEKKSAQFNKYLEPNVTKETAMRDAKEFIESCAIIDKQKVREDNQVSIDEWLFSFAKLLFCNKQLFDKFLADYYKVLEKNGTFKDALRAAEAAANSST